MIQIDCSEQSDLDLHCLLKRLQDIPTDNKTIRLFVICALRVNKCEFRVYTVMILMKYTHVCVLKQLIISLTKL